jgi:hypothetical protein
MINRGPQPLLAGRISSLYLDYGADAQTCDKDSVELSERGLRMVSRWRFEIGMQLSVAFVSHHTRTGPRRVCAEGIVVWCEPLASDPKMYESTVLFLELPDDLKQNLRDFSCGLAETPDGAE